MTDITDSLLINNPWWKEDFKIAFNHRELYDKIQKYLKLPQIIAFTGLRRVGKTTMMLKIVEDHIRNGFEPSNIIYFTFDELREISLKELIKRYEEILEKDIRKGKYILFLDEIQKLKDWENQLKVIYDLYIKKVKIIISGSESLYIKKKSKETLAGRIFEFKLDPLSFQEFLFFKQIKFRPIKLYEKELIKQFEIFLHTQGFPELVEIKDKEIISKYIKESIIEKIIFKDIPSLYKIKDITIIESLLKIFMDDPGQIIELSSLGNDLNISRQTLSSYIRYLEDSFLIKKLYNYSPNKRKVERKLKKYYSTILSPHLIFKQDDLSRSKVFEWIMVNQLQADFFWRDPYKNEVDIVKVNKEIIPMEIKYGKIEITGVKKFLEKYRLNMGIIISNRKEEIKKIKGKTIKIIPGYKLLLGPYFE